MAIGFALGGCQASPSQDILGSYFPSWMLCALVGISLTIGAYRFFLKQGIDEFLPLKSLVYLGLTISMTFLTWIFWFRN